MVGIAGQLADSAMPGWGDYTFVSGIVICVEKCPLPICSRQIGPELLSAGLATVADVKGDDLAGVGVHRNPHPLPVCLLTYEAPELVQLGLQPLQDYRRGAFYRFGIEIFEGRLEPRSPMLLPSSAHAGSSSAPSMRSLTSVMRSSARRM
jgi:hypothetical protein